MANDMEDGAGMETAPKRGLLGFLKGLRLRGRQDAPADAEDFGLPPETEENSSPADADAFSSDVDEFADLVDGIAAEVDAAIRAEATDVEGTRPAAIDDEAEDVQAQADDPSGNETSEADDAAPAADVPPGVSVAEDALSQVRGNIVELIASRAGKSEGSSEQAVEDGSEEIVIEAGEESFVEDASGDVPQAIGADGNAEDSQKAFSDVPQEAVSEDSPDSPEVEPADGSCQEDAIEAEDQDGSIQDAEAGKPGKGRLGRLIEGIRGRFWRKGNLQAGMAVEESVDEHPELAGQADAGEGQESEDEDDASRQAGNTVDDGVIHAQEGNAEADREAQESVGEAGEDAADDGPAALPALRSGEGGGVEGSGPASASDLPETRPVILRADGTPLPRHRLGEYVLNKGLITVEALDAASREQEVTGERIGQILVANGFLSDRDRVEAILATSSERIAQESVVRSRIPSHVLDEYNIMISAETEETIYVSTMQDEEVVERIVREYYGDKRIEFVSFLPSSMNSFIATIKKSAAMDDASQSRETMLDRILYRALNEGASDIHIIPRRKSYTAMFRLLGVRRIVHEGALDEYKVVIAQVKDRARMDLAERRKPQDGGFQIEYAGKMIDLRVATVPTAEGETCVLRVLDPDRVQPSLGQLGITDVEKWRKGFNQQHGLCLICGPTGSGKTTTLNSSIKEMDRFGKAIYTIEDPVEYRIPYAGQVSVNTAVGLNFASAVRAFMRADPDVIVLGEVRDEETARNAIKAADTGHLVLATLHTGSIIGAVSRLKDLGIAPRELRYLLRAVLVQSLVRTVCRHCEGKGCVACKGSGYSGRTVVSECEYFEGPEQVDRIINAGEHDVERTWPTMAEDAVAKYRKGITDLDELYRVFGASIEPYLREEPPS